MKENIIIAIISSLLTSFVWAEVIPKEKEYIEVVRIEKQKVDWDKLIEAIIWRESGGNNKAVNRKTNAVGCMQIRPIYLKQCNKIVGYEKYKLSDRYSRKNLLKCSMYISLISTQIKTCIWL